MVTKWLCSEISSWLSASQWDSSTLLFAPCMSYLQYVCTVCAFKSFFAWLFEPCPHGVFGFLYSPMSSSRSSLVCDSWHESHHVSPIPLLRIEASYLLVEVPLRVENPICVRSSFPFFIFHILPNLYWSFPRSRGCYTSEESGLFVSSLHSFHPSGASPAGHQGDSAHSLHWCFEDARVSWWTLVPQAKSKKILGTGDQMFPSCGDDSPHINGKLINQGNRFSLDSPPSELGQSSKQRLVVNSVQLVPGMRGFHWAVRRKVMI